MASPQLRRELQGIALLLLGVFVAGALIFPGNLSVGCTDAGGVFGPVGACARSALVGLFGFPAAILLPLIPIAHALRLFGRLEADADISWLVFLGGIVLLLPVVLAIAMGAAEGQDLREGGVQPWTGLWGSLIGYYMLRAFGTVGSWVVLVLAASALTAGTLRWNPLRLMVGTRRRTVDGVAAGDEGPTLASLLEPPPEEMPAMEPALIGSGASASSANDAAEDDSSDGTTARGNVRRGGRAPRGKSAVSAEREEAVAAEIASTAELLDVTSEDLPDASLLTPPPPHNPEIGKRELDAMGVKLIEALRTFKVEGELGDRTTGPVVTQFEVIPAAGVKVRQIANLSNDLALAMRAPSIRIVAPIPGRGAVGVEVPNPTAEIVAFRELIESREFTTARLALPIALGKDLEGRPVIADLARMPHLLIAGATGSGKSVCVNTIITSLVYRHTPRTLRFLMVDPKMVELSVYNVLPHLRHKVVTDNRDAAAVLKWAVLEMQERYQLLAANGARNLQDFNRRVLEGAKLTLPKRPEVAFEDLTYHGGILPYIVVVIDELADLMMTVQGEVETPLAMLAQKARAIGIHLILATQRPSVNVITGLIKANFPSRIAFRVASQVDSRTILDGMGAESLLGNGDMLFIPPGKSEPSRLQGAYISSEDTERLMNWYEDRRERRRRELEEQGLMAEESSQTEADILEEVRKREAELAGAADGDGESADDADRDKLFREAAEVVIQHQQGSTSLLQRRLKVGYGRAARIIDQLHYAGVLGPPDGSKPRDILVGLEELDRICGPR